MDVNLYKCRKNETFRNIYLIKNNDDITGKATCKRVYFAIKLPLSQLLK